MLPPLTGVAVIVVFWFAQILSPPAAAMLTAGVNGVVTCSLMALDVAVDGNAQLALDVSTTEMTSPSLGVATLNVALVAPVTAVSFLSH